jgi:hypothetical protein
MLVRMDSVRLYELIAEYANLTNKYILFIDTSKYFSLSTEKKQLVKDFYADIIPQDEHLEIFSNKMTFYKFIDQVTAVDHANDWFPSNRDLEDQDYFFECQVITPSGSITYTNRY